VWERDKVGYSCTIIKMKVLVFVGVHSCIMIFGEKFESS